MISCIATLLASRPGESRMVGDTLQAFTASFPGLKNDETNKVEDLCRLIESVFTRSFPAEQGEIEKCLTWVAWNMEAPFFSPAVIVHDMLMELVRSTDIHDHARWHWKRRAVRRIRLVHPSRHQG